MTPRGVPRSLLYVPAHHEKMIAGAARRSAHALILDLEDAVPQDAKATARERLAESVRTVGADGARVLVRSNAPWSLAWRDLEAAAAAGAGGLLLPKVDAPAVVEVLGAYLVELEERFDLPPLDLLLTIESSRGLQAVGEIAAALAGLSSAGDRLTALVPGNEDLSLSLRMEPTPERMAGALWPLFLAARAHGHALIGSVGSGADYRDLAAYRERLERSRSYGFEGTTCIHPAQVPIANEVHRPSAADLAWARTVVAAFEARGGEAVGVDGQMIDRPVYARAKRWVDEAEP
ncbi:MAG: CoA ester lyase [Trueperaceae bacterium]|nr:CoA ester lyase [Trueperaceae bacterium]